MTSLYANSYDLSAIGFYFESAEDYKEKAAKLRNSYGDPVEEFEIEFIDGEQIDAEFGKVWGLDQSNFPAFLEACDDWCDNEKVSFIIVVGECGGSFDHEKVKQDEFEVYIYQCDTMRELAKQFIDEGFLGDIPEHLENYIDYDAIARDFSFDYTETSINGETLIYICG